MMSFSKLNTSTTQVKNELRYEMIHQIGIHFCNQTKSEPEFSIDVSLTYERVEMKIGFEQANLSYKSYSFRG